MRSREELRKQFPHFDGSPYRTRPAHVATGHHCSAGGSRPDRRVPAEQAIRGGRRRAGRAAACSQRPSHAHIDCRTSRGASLRAACSVCGATADDHGRCYRRDASSVRTAADPSGNPRDARSTGGRTRSPSRSVARRTDPGVKSPLPWIGHRACRGATTQLVPLRRADPAKVREAVTMIRDAALRTAPGETMAAVPVARSRGIERSRRTSCR